jgi:hypothetical protein
MQAGHETYISNRGPDAVSPIAEGDRLAVRDKLLAVERHQLVIRRGIAREVTRKLRETLDDQLLAAGHGPSRAPLRPRSRTARLSSTPDRMSMLLGRAGSSGEQVAHAVAVGAEPTANPNPPGRNPRSSASPTP